ncbi:aldehyde dehydrogenase family protein [Streptomyces sp. LP05-1]|uniref:aldehyde dehydrogenase (NAD(+)) n=1 Tax=Streptomyces pyxinae TaxID=2970734 RepID=A0ABT2CBH7_9ACTN|nr:aldehyde dehydrogenase family protein [Streptomyces sp. LP05-1]MCS0634758.1 aldehyde dehydrogenase family protein [Streptomyces sp. LP05-1]
MTTAPGPDTVVSRNPADPADLVLTVPSAGADGVRAAVAAARTAAGPWARAGAAARATALHTAARRLEDAAEELAALVRREVGKPVTEARGEVARTVAVLRYYAQAPYEPVGAVHEPAAGEGLLLTRRTPYGVAGLVTPWNFPLAVPVWKAAPALATGNAVVLKPAPPATACALRLAELLGGALPDGLFTVVPGGAGEGAALVGAADVVSFTGSTAAGRTVVRAATDRGLPVQAEMGGQNAALVLPDADPGAAADQIALALAGYAGQKCTATRRIIVVGDGAPLAEALVARLAALRTGDPGDPETVCGPLISAGARDRVLAAPSGGRVLSGGAAPAGLDGWYALPTLVDRLPAGHRLATEEVFGPVAALFPVPDPEAAVALANAVPYGLVASVHTTDLDAALRCADRLDTGLVRINAPTTGVDFHLPFGGAKASGHGPREQGKAALEFYTRTRTVSLMSSGHQAG